MDGDLAVPPGGFNEFHHALTGFGLDVAGDGEGGEYDREVRVDGFTFPVVIGRACRSCLDMRKECSISHSRW